MLELIEFHPFEFTPIHLFGLVSSIALGMAGFVIFRRGRKLGMPRLTWVGVILMVYPDLVPNPWLMWCVGFGLLWLALKQWEPRVDSEETTAQANK